MNETVGLLLTGLVGFSLGTVFFGGLWWTVRRSRIGETASAVVSG